jgi:hypothetical protein
MISWGPTSVLAVYLSRDKHGDVRRMRALWRKSRMGISTFKTSQNIELQGGLTEKTPRRGDRVGKGFSVSGRNDRRWGGGAGADESSSMSQLVECGCLSVNLHILYSLQGRHPRLPSLIPVRSAACPVSTAPLGQAFAPEDSHPLYNCCSAVQCLSLCRVLLFRFEFSVRKFDRSQHRRRTGSAGAPVSRSMGPARHALLHQRTRPSCKNALHTSLRPCGPTPCALAP